MSSIAYNIVKIRNSKDYCHTVYFLLGIYKVSLIAKCPQGGPGESNCRSLA